MQCKIKHANTFKFLLKIIFLGIPDSNRQLLNRFIIVDTNFRQIKKGSWLNKNEWTDLNCSSRKESFYITDTKIVKNQMTIYNSTKNNTISAHTNRKYQRKGNLQKIKETKLKNYKEYR